MINRVVLVGRLTKDVEVRKTTSGLSVCQFTVAVDRRVPKNDTSGQPKADFVPCVAWRQSADFLGNYARKGNLVGVEGRIQTRSYDDKDGKKVFVTEVLCDNVQLLESRKSREAAGGNTSGGYANDYTPAPAGNSASAGTTVPRAEDGDETLVISSDDLPF